jgi:uncharacterized protein YpmS
MLKSKSLWSVVLILFMSGLACSLPSRLANRITELPTSTPTVNPLGLEEQLATAAADFQETGQISITITEQQLTSFIDEKLAQQTDIPLSEPQVSLQNGKIILEGKVTIGFVSAQTRLVFAPTVVDGKIEVEIVSADFGSIPIPESTLEQITQIVNQNIVEYISADGSDIQIDTIVIADGTITITGKAR